MAITVSAAGPKTIMSWPFLVTTNDVTFTLDGSLTEKAVAGTAHGGPTGAEPVMVLFQRHGGTAATTSGVIFAADVTNYDTTNDEVDYTLEWNAAGTNAETVIMRMYCVFVAARDKHEGVDTNAP